MSHARHGDMSHEGLAEAAPDALRFCPCEAVH